MKKKLLSNSFFNISSLATKICLTFIMTPIIIRSLGNYDYGIWEIGISVIGYMGLLQFGIEPATVRYVATYKALEDNENLHYVFSTALCIMAIGGFVCFSVLIAFAFLAPEILSGKNQNPLKYTYYLSIMAFQVQVVFVGMLFQGFHEGYQRYSITKGIVIINSIIGAIVTYSLLKRGYGLIAVAAVGTAGVTLKFFIYFLLLRLKRFGGFRFHLKHVSKNTARSLTSFGFKSFLLGISGRISNSAAPIIIGSFLGPAIVPFYTIPMGLIRRINTFVAAITLGFMPYFSELHAQQAFDRKRQLYFDASRYITSFVLCSYIGIFSLGLPFIARWIGPSYAEKGKIVFFLIALAFLLPMVNPLHGRVLTSMSRHGALAKVRLCSAVVNISLSLLLVQFFGIEGVALATLAPKTIVEPLILLIVSKHLRFKAHRYLTLVLLPLAAPVLLSSATYYLLLQMVMPNSYTEILLIGATGSTVYLASFFFISVSRSERQRLFFAAKNMVMPKMKFNSR